MECVEKIIRKNDMLCPMSGKTLSEKDIIRIIRVSIIACHFLTSYVPYPFVTDQNKCVDKLLTCKEFQVCNAE